MNSMHGDNKNLKTLGERILFTQKESGMSQKKFCELAGISLSILRKYIDGTSNPSYSSLMVIHEAGEVNLHWLMTGEGDPKTGMSMEDKNISPAQRVQIRELVRRCMVMIEQEEDKQHKVLDPEIKAMMMSELIIQGLIDGSYSVNHQNVVDLVHSAKVAS